MPADPNKLKKMNEIGRKEIVFSAVRMPETSRLFFGTSDFKVYDMDLAEEKPEAKELSTHESYVTGVARTEKAIVSGSWDGKLMWWDLAAGKTTHTIDAHQKWIRNIACSPDLKVIASVGDDMFCRLWDANTGNKLHELKGHQEKTPHHYPSMLYAVAISPDSKYVATADRVGHIVIWEIATGKEMKSLESPEHYTWDPNQRRHSIGGIRSLAFSPDGQQLAVGGMAKVGNIDHLGGKALLHLYDWQKGERVHDLESGDFKGLVEHIEYHPEGKWLLAAGGDNGGFLWFLNPKDGNAIKTEKAPMHIHSFAFNDSLETLYTVGHNKIAVFELKG